MNPHNRSHLCVLLSFVVAAIAVTWPLALRFSQGVPYGGDAFQFVWNGWWFRKALADPHLSVWWTPCQYAPIGTSLVLHDLSPLNSFIQAQLIPFIGDFASYNLLIIFHYVLAAWGAYILAWYLTGNRPASVIAGVIYGFSVYHAMHLSQLGTVSSGWLPLSVYYLLKFTRDGGWRDGVLSILMLLAAALSHWYQLAFSAVMFFGLMLIGQFGLRDHLGGMQRWTRAILPWLAATLILSPLIIAAWDESRILGTAWQVEMGKMYLLDPAWAVLPPPDHPFLGALSKPLAAFIPGNATEGVVSLGLVAIVLGFLSWFRRNPTTRAWCWLGLILFILALGPTLTILSLQPKISLFGYVTHIPGPFRLWSEIPGLNLVRVPARFVGPFTLALGIGAAGWVAGLGPVWRTGWLRAILLWLLPVLIVLETTVAPIPISGNEYRHPALKNLAKIYSDATGDPNPPDLIINYPLLPQRRPFLLQQTIHQIPTMDGELSYPPPGAMEFYLDFNWNPRIVKDLGIDMVLYHPWAAKTSLGEHFDVGDREVPPLEFFRDIAGYKVAYQDERLIVFIP